MNGTCRWCGHAMDLHREKGCLGKGWLVRGYGKPNVPACKCIVKPKP